MVRQVSNVFDELQISLLMLRHGWSCLTITTRGEILNCEVSGVFSNVVAGLIDLCHAVIDNVTIKVPFYDEPGGHVWKVTTIADQRTHNAFPSR